ncbi:MAG: mannonate dehydratase [Alphaproteobacteria bacterium]
MKQTWRWFGPNDLVSIDDMRQAGVEGVVSALHQHPPGVVWTLEDIQQRQREIATMSDGSPSTLTWDVVESLPVSEDIKQQQGDWRAHLENYRTSLEALARAEIEVVCYNFMPILDWTRTDLAHRRPTGATAMSFDAIDFAAYDLFILGREGAEASFDPGIVEVAKERFAAMSDEAAEKLANTVTFGLPGAAQNFGLQDVKALLALYGDISADQLRAHLIAFLEEVIPTAERLGLRLCCHPDDPPFPLLGLPRVVSTEADYQHFLNAVDSPANGVTLCSGSLGVRADNDLPGMMQRLGERVHFLHLRNVTTQGEGLYRSFFEDEHLAGNTDMVALLAAVHAEEQRRKAEGRADWSIPLRPDHGQDILDDQGRKTQPGYPSIGRLKGLAELRGVWTALDHPALGLTART